MATIITGLFASQSQSKKISKDLQTAGFTDDDFIMYLHEENISKEVKTSIWRSLFKDNTVLEDDSLVVSVKAKETDAQKKVKEVFAENEVIHENFIENIKFKDAQSLEYLRRVVSLRAKSKIYSSPEIRQRGAARGINSEVFFGKN